MHYDLFCIMNIELCEGTQMNNKDAEILCKEEQIAAYGIGLSEAQAKAVTHEGPALVVAGAGSGKTRTLTAKVAYLINSGYPPERILAITFTNKAADEMKQRLSQVTGLPPQRFPWVRTFHSACFQILKIHCTRIGFTSPLQVASDYHQQKLLKDLLIKHNIDRKHLYSVRSAVSFAKNSGDPERYIGHKAAKLPYPLAEIFKDYQDELKRMNAVDFDDILLFTRNLLRDDHELLEKYRDYFVYVLVDEYQDTNDLQEDLTRLLAGSGNLFCVGDDWQAIYGFRGSNVNHFLTFAQRYPESVIFRLEQNYRSADEIVRIANSLIEKNPDRVDKKCFSDIKGGIIRFSIFFSEDDEAEWVARQILELEGEGIPYEEMAVLYRTRFCSRAIERALRWQRIPYKLLGDKGFFDRMEILDLNCYLISAVFPKDDTAFERILNVPKRGIGPKMIEKINLMRPVGGSLQDAARIAVKNAEMPPKIHKAVSDLIELLDNIRDMHPADALGTVIERTGYEKYLGKVSKSEQDFNSRKENIAELVYAASRHSDIISYLEEAALVREDKEDGDDAAGGVSLATIHASKGLEFSVVFIIGCEENLLPHWKSIDDKYALQEERRLMYVAMTRARTHLYITASEFRRGGYNPPSRFIKDIEDALNN